MTRAALYLRVSREDLAIENQRPELEALALRRGLEVVAVYESQVSGAAKHRPEHDRMLQDAHERKFDVLVVWALDRFGRSMFENIRDVMTLDRAGVAILSVKEPWLDAGGPTRQLLVAIFSWVAEQERARLIERTKAGIERARAAGKRIGRKPRVTPELAAQIAKKVAEDWTIRDIAAALKIPKATVYRTVRALPRAATSKDCTDGPSPSGHAEKRASAPSASDTNEANGPSPPDQARPGLLPRRGGSRASTTPEASPAAAPSASDKPTPGCLRNPSQGDTSQVPETTSPRARLPVHAVTGRL